MSFEIIIQEKTAYRQIDQLLTNKENYANISALFLTDDRRANASGSAEESPNVYSKRSEENSPLSTDKRYIGGIVPQRRYYLVVFEQPGKGETCGGVGLPATSLRCPRGTAVVNPAERKSSLGYPLRYPWKSSLA